MPDSAVEIVYRDPPPSCGGFVIPSPSTATVPGVELTFPAPNRPVSINERLHWAVLRRRLAPWRTSLRWAYLAAGSPSLGPSVVTVEVPFARAGRRDPHNYVAPLVKALVDELVACGAWPDDTPEWVSVAEPVLVVGKDAQVVVRIESR